MSTGFTNNNYGNINLNSGTDWEGSTGKFTITKDGQKNIIFENPVYGLRAMMVILGNYISKYGLYNISDVLGRWSPLQTAKERYQRANQIAKKYFNGANPEDDILNLSDHDILGLTKGIIEGEIPEYKLIPNNYYDAALRYYNSGDDVEAKTFISSIKNDSSIYLFLGFAVISGYFYFKKKKVF
jgi:hypothetical protein